MQYKYIKKILHIIKYLISGILGFLFLIELWSARIPPRWQEITADMNRVKVRSFIGSQPTVISYDYPFEEDIWIQERLIGTWRLEVRYHEGLFFTAHLNYSSLGREHARCRNYHYNDPPYEERQRR